jgi:ketosteroid isomerase-like protein
MLATGCGLTICSLGCTRQQTPPDTRAAAETATRHADLGWSKATTDRQLEATVSYDAPDAAIYPPNAPTASGKDAIRAVRQEYFATPGFVVTCHPVKIEASRSGAIGYTQGPYNLAFADAKGNAIKDRGKYLAVWKKQSDGAWRVVADIFNSDQPQAPVGQYRNSINARATVPVTRR